MKPTAKNEPKPKAADTLAHIAETVLAYRDERPSLHVIARIIGRASGLLRISDLDERLSVENAATMAVAKKHSLIS